jgi:hypothetical protein
MTIGQITALLSYCRGGARPGIPRSASEVDIAPPLPAVDWALDGIPGPTALHLCFGYAYVARDKPNGYAFLPELTASEVEQISIEIA